MVTRTATGITGTITTCPTDPPRPCGVYVYQHVRPGLGNVAADPTRALQLRLWRATPNPNTQLQQIVRATFRAAVHAWQAMTPDDRDAWREAAHGTPLSGYHTFISAALLGQL